MSSTSPTSSVAHASSDVGQALHDCLTRACEAAGGWLPFDRFMALALYEPGLGYYANGRVTFGRMPGGEAAGGARGELPGSDFVTAPELSPVFGQMLGAQVVQALQATGCDEVWEFGAGSGALAQQILEQASLMDQAGKPQNIRKYTIVDLSGVLRQRQRERLAAWGDRVQWADALPERFAGVVVGNEVLDAMPVRLLVRRGGQWFERGVVPASPVAPTDTAAQPAGAPRWAWADRPTEARPPVDMPDHLDPGHDYVTEIHPQAEGFVRTLADRMVRGAAFFIDYGFPEDVYYHPQRHMGTLACHHLHRMDDNPLARVGEKDITAHVNFTGVALAAQDAGLSVLGYTTQGRFLINCGLAQALDALPTDAAGIAARAMAAKLVQEHEMGELFKVLALAPVGSDQGWVPMGFAVGDRTHTL